MTAVRGGSARRVDPRLQARRRSVARRTGLRRLWIVLGLTVVASLAIGAIALVRSSLLDVEAIEVEGGVRVDRSHVLTASGIEIGAPLVEIDTNGALARVLAVPWVADASIRRSWRGTVTIAVVERQPLMALPSGSRWAIVDRAGQQLELVAEPPSSFVPIAGVEASGVPGQLVGDVGLAVVAVVDQMPPALAEVTEQVVVDGGAVHLVLSTGGRVNLGDERSLDDKFVSLETMLARADLRCVDTIDVRVPSAPTIRRLTTDTETEEPLVDPGGC